VFPGAIEDKYAPQLSNIKGAVFEVQIPYKYKIANRLRKLKAKLEKSNVRTENRLIGAVGEK